MPASQSSVNTPIDTQHILDHYLIITTVNKNYLRIFDIWHHFFKKSDYQPILRVITLDKTSESHISGKSIKTIHPGKYSESFSKIIQWRFEEIDKLLQKGKSIIQSDADAFWINPNLEQIIDEQFDIQSSIGYGIPQSAIKKWGFSLCTGFMILQSRPMVLNLMQDWLKECSLVKDDQVAFNNLFLKSRMRWELDNVKVNRSFCEDYNININAIDTDQVSRPFNKNAFIYHPFLNSNHQLFKIKILSERLKSLPDPSGFLEKHIKSVLTNPKNWCYATYGWIKVSIHKAIKKIQVKDDWS